MSPENESPTIAILTSAEREQAFALFFHGPTWDGDLVSKTARDSLDARGWLHRHDGWQTLSKAGLLGCLSSGMDDEKDRRRRDARRRK